MTDYGNKEKYGLNGLNRFLKTRNAAGQTVILTDENTHEHCLPLLEKSNPELVKNSEILMVPAGETAKSPEVLISLWQTMIEHEIDRDALLINLGGGVVTDLGGFAASAYKRGISFVHVPTTLLAMVDASAGGKTGINLSGLKNQIGSFSEPEAVFYDTRFFQTLDRREFLSGAAELYKHALIAGGELYEKVTNTDLSNPEEMTPELISQAVRVKLKITDADFRESGKRKILNLGHTVGHAIESGTMDSENALKHGEAVALGLAVECFIAEHVAGLNPDVTKEILKSLTYYYPDAFRLVFDEEMIVTFCRGDKKRASGVITMPLLEKIGKPVLCDIADEQLIRNAVKRYNEL